MKKITHSLQLIHITRMLSKSFLVGTLATLGFVASSIVSSSKAEAQTPSSVEDDQIVKYSRALLNIEKSRIQAFDEIKKISGGRQLPEIVCNEPKSLESLSPRRARDIAQKYCQRSQKIVEENGLSIQIFNKITLKLKNDASLKRQIHEQLILLQNKPLSP